MLVDYPRKDRDVAVWALLGIVGHLPAWYVSESDRFRIAARNVADVIAELNSADEWFADFPAFFAVHGRSRLIDAGAPKLTLTRLLLLNGRADAMAKLVKTLTVKMFPQAPVVPLGLSVKAARIAADMSRLALAERAGVREETVGNLERTSQGQIGVLSAILDALGCTIAGVPEHTSVGDWLIGMRMGRQLSQRQVATSAGLSAPTIAKLETSAGQLSSLTAVLAVFGHSLQIRFAEVRDDALPRMPAKDARQEIYHDDCRVRMRLMIEEGRRFSAFLGDPPYGLFHVNDAWDRAEVAFDPELWRLVFDLLLPGAHLMAFAAPRNAHKLASALEGIGFEIRDQISAVNSGTLPAGDVNVSAAIDKHLKHERVVTGRQPRAGRATTTMRGGRSENRYSGLRRDIPVSAQAVKYQGFHTQLKNQSEMIIVARRPLSERTVAGNVLKWGTGALHIDAARVPGVIKRTRPTPGEPYWSPNEKGRWPGTVMFSGYDAMPWAPFYHHARPQGDQRWGHECSKDVHILRILVRLICPPGGAILDCFAGSGSVSEACVREGMDYSGIEQSFEHAATAEQRIAETQAELAVTLQVTSGCREPQATSIKLTRKRPGGPAVYSGGYPH